MWFLDERQKSFPVSLPWGKAPDMAEINSTDGEFLLMFCVTLTVSVTVLLAEMKMLFWAHVD